MSSVLAQMGLKLRPRQHRVDGKRVRDYWICPDSLAQAEADARRYYERLVASPSRAAGVHTPEIEAELDRLVEELAA